MKTHHRFFAGMLVIGLALAVSVSAKAFLTLKPPGVVTIHPLTFPVSLWFNDEPAINKMYGSARDTFAYVTSLNSVGQKIRPSAGIDQKWNVREIWDYRQIVLSGAFNANLYPMNGYNHFHLGFLDAGMGAQSLHVPPFDNLPTGFGCFCHPSGETDLAEGDYYGFAPTRFPNWWDVGPWAQWSRNTGYPICNWDGTFADPNTGNVPNVPAFPCQYWANGRGGVTPHDGAEFIMFDLQVRKYDPATNTQSIVDGTLQNFTLDSIVLGSGGDMEIWTVDPNGVYNYYGPLGAGTVWSPDVHPVVQYMFFHDWNGGNNFYGQPAGRSNIQGLNIHI